MDSLKEFVFEYAKEKYTTEPDYPFTDDFETAVLRHKSNKKWYGLVMKVPLSKFDFEDNKTVDVLNLKCDTLMSGSFRLQKGIYPAYHMNKNSWISVLLDGTVDKETIMFLIDTSYILTETKKKNHKNK